jgi:putative ABC transport system permease protein
MAGPVAWASVREGVDALRTNPLRTFLSTLGVVIGVAALVSILSLGDGLEAYAREQVEQHTGVQNVSVSPVTTDLVDGVRLPREKWPRLTTADADAARREIPGVAAVSLSAHGTTTVVPPQGGGRAPRASPPPWPTRGASTGSSSPPGASSRRPRRRATNRSPSCRTRWLRRSHPRASTR